MKIQAVRPVTPPMKLCHNCRHCSQSLANPVCETCRKYANWEEVLADAVSRSGDSPQNGRPV